MQQKVLRLMRIIRKLALEHGSTPEVGTVMLHS